jgi:hypothetical protein
MLGGDAFGVELHALDREVAVAKAHDRAVLEPRGDLEAIGQARALHDQRMVARGSERGGQAREDALAVVMHLSELAVHDPVCAHDAPAEGLADGLVAEADTEKRYAGLGRGLREREADAGLIGVAGAGGQDDPAMAASPSLPARRAHRCGTTTSAPSSPR